MGGALASGTAGPPSAPPAPSAASAPGELLKDRDEERQIENAPKCEVRVPGSHRARRADHSRGCTVSPDPDARARSPSAAVGGSRGRTPALAMTEGLLPAAARQSAQQRRLRHGDRDVTESSSWFRRWSPLCFPRRTLGFARGLDDVLLRWHVCQSLGRRVITWVGSNLESPWSLFKFVISVPRPGLQPCCLARGEFSINVCELRALTT